ncbi:hypothetical protein [Streptomyces sp. SAI-041]|uniref:hypothetical protein n=1 Tax=Streptomyces sp. SAI-041 TaxID=2940548 RepID=UPI002474D36A|nr:hypothetical protein [Streptomyces sp. SAI-041]
MVITASSARDDSPLFEASWIRPGTHLSCMGADAPANGQYVPADTVLAPLGEVLTGRLAGRTADSAGPVSGPGPTREDGHLL